jgi:pSer/pThr/pTyr-binding forkhead associated (FHA) protein
MLRILLKFNDSVLKVIESDKAEITLGRNLKNDIQIDNLAVSNFHARIEHQLGHYFIEDLNSTNGTYVNDKKISKWGLQDGDTASIGKHSLVFMLEGGQVAGEGIRELNMDQTMVLDTEKQRELVEKAELTSAGPPARLKLESGKASHDEYQMTARLTEIGKGETAQVRLEGLFAPKNVAYVTRDPKGYTLVPGDNGDKLRLNGVKIDKGTTLKNGDVIVAGKAHFRFYQK